MSTLIVCDGCGARVRSAFEYFTINHPPDALFVPGETVAHACRTCLARALPRVPRVAPGPVGTSN